MKSLRKKEPIPFDRTTYQACFLAGVSGMYVDEDGFLMCGLQGKSTSIVEGFRCAWHDEEDLSLRIEPINDLGEICGEYYR